MAVFYFQGDWLHIYKYTWVWSAGLCFTGQDLRDNDGPRGVAYEATDRATDKTTGKATDEAACKAVHKTNCKATHETGSSNLHPLLPFLALVSCRTQHTGARALIRLSVARPTAEPGSGTPFA